MSPTTRNLDRLHRRGSTAGVVESFIAAASFRRDLFGVGDLLAVHPRGRAFLLIQSTIAGHVAHRAVKAGARPELRDWLVAGASSRYGAAASSAGGGNRFHRRQTVTNLPRITLSISRPTLLHEAGSRQDLQRLNGPETARLFPASSFSYIRTPYQRQPQWQEPNSTRSDRRPLARTWKCMTTQYRRRERRRQRPVTSSPHCTHFAQMTV
jgi:hypothetical protein